MTENFAFTTDRCTAGGTGRQGLQGLALDAGETGGAGRDRTDDLLLAKQALSQLSYSPDKLHDASLLGTSFTSR